MKPIVANGRPQGALGRPHGVDLTVANLVLSGVPTEAIARMMDLTVQSVLKVKAKPGTQAYISRMSAAFVEDIRPGMNRVAEAIAGSTMEAVETVRDVMRRMREDPTPQAQRVALASAQDILDRAGHKAALRVEEAKVHAVHPDSLKQLGQVLTELRGREPLRGEVCTPEGEESE